MHILGRPPQPTRLPKASEGRVPQVPENKWIKLS
jgi:hypothetical protein